MGLLTEFITNGTPQLKEPILSQWQNRLNTEIWTPNGLREVIGYQAVIDKYNIHPDAVDADAQKRAMAKDYNRMMELWRYAMLHVPSIVLGIDMSMHQPVNRWLMALMLTESAQKVTAEQFYFWSGSDIANVDIMRPLSDDATIPADTITAEWFEAQKTVLPEFTNPDYVRLATAFKAQLVNEASGHIPFVGDLIMQHEPIPAIDALIQWDSLRLMIRPYGIWATFVGKSGVMPIYWQPDRHTIRTLTGGIIAYVADVVLAGIWRDACIVRESTWHERTQYHPRPLKKSQRHNNPVVLPRTVYNVQWGASVEERDTIIRATHSVRPHYRYLGDDRKATGDALATADDYGMPHPPTGYTFVRPHVRGSGEMQNDAIKRVICRGLKTVKIALGKVDE